MTSCAFIFMHWHYFFSYLFHSLFPFCPHILYCSLYLLLSLYLFDISVVSYMLFFFDFDTDVSLCRLIVMLSDSRQLLANYKIRAKRQLTFYSLVSRRDRCPDARNTMNEQAQQNERERVCAFVSCANECE